ncbi:RNA-splicing ligase RtcB [Thermoplasmatales archaeon SW_10_69_26]|nr:MAG: RNA-splicing ligase RtcB [Thermoplasmatales archaeon SW_10_69_26]
MTWDGPLDRVDEYTYEIPASYKKEMRVPGRVYASEGMLDQILEDNAMEQVANVATLPGIVDASMAMPDIHWGYGFPIGGVAAFDVEEGIISPGGVGYDINCGVRLVRTGLTADEVEPKIDELIDTLFAYCPSGVGEDSQVSFSKSELEDILTHGVPHLVEQGYGWEDDPAHIEHDGAHPDAAHEYASKKAKERGRTQIGTLGAGNHFLEIQQVGDIVRSEEAEAFGFTEPGQIVLMIHSGSRGFGHQVCTDYLKRMERSREGMADELVDKQLACAPFTSDVGQHYYGAMCAAINYAFANRQMLTHQARQAFGDVFGEGPDRLGMDIVYDVAHNIAKRETHQVDGGERDVLVHRKGATRAYPSGHVDVSGDYRDVGQPVIIPGSMGTCSWVLAGEHGSMKRSFGSTCHGAGRKMSRTEAKNTWRGRTLVEDLGDRGIKVKPASMRVAAEEAPGAYKDVSGVVDTCEGLGISKKVTKLDPVGVIKG